MNEEACLLELTELFEAVKSASDNPQWVVTKRGQKSQVRLSCPLAIDGAVVHGLRLEIYGPKSPTINRPFEGLTALLMATNRRSNWHMGRIEFDPVNTLQIHRNIPNSLGAPPFIRGAHYHPFQANSKIGLSALSPDRDLPIAFELSSEIRNFNDVLSTIEEQFLIPGLWLEEPQWSPQML